MGRYLIHKDITGEADQKIYYVGVPFDENTIDVFLNENIQTSNVDYKTNQDIGAIVFQKEIKNYDKISIRSSVGAVGSTLNVISYGRRDKNPGLFSRYGQTQKLKINNRYEVQFCIRKKRESFSFSSTLSPFLTTVKKVREDINKFIDDYSDEYVASMIHRASHDMIAMIDDLAENGTENVEYSVDSDGIYTSTAKAVERWVRYSTEIRLMLAKYYGISGEYGAISKKLGDIEISKTSKLPYIDQMLKRLERDLAGVESTIRGSYSIQSFLKAGTKAEYQGRTTWF